MTLTWIVVADSSRARIFSMNGVRSPLQEVTGMEHVKSRLPERELISDRHGRSFDSGGQGRHAMETSVSPKKQEAIIFSKSIAGYLDIECGKRSFARLILIAAPEFLGLLRKDLGEKARRAIFREISKNLTHHGEPEIRRHVTTLPE